VEYIYELPRSQKYVSLRCYLFMGSSYTCISPTIVKVLVDDLILLIPGFCLMVWQRWYHHRKTVLVARQPSSSPSLPTRICYLLLCGHANSWILAVPPSGNTNQGLIALCSICSVCSLAKKLPKEKSSKEKTKGVDAEEEMG
jgi:hypothetical protein